MTLKHAILGLLNYEPMTGYDLKKMIDISINHFWPAVQSQVYTTLSKMEKEGWVSVETIPQEPLPPRKVYSLTPVGKAEFVDWLTTPQACGETRIAWLVQVFFAGQLDDEKTLTLLYNLKSVFQQRLEGYSSIPDENRDSLQNDPMRDKFFWMLTVDYGVAQSIEQIKWIDKVIQTVEAHEYILPTLAGDGM